MAALKRQRAKLDQEIEAWRRIAEDARTLIEATQPGDIYEAAPRPPSADDDGKNATFSAKRFAKSVIPLADRLISERAGVPVTIEEIYAALSPQLRADLDKTSDTHSAVFRIRRMLRRHKDRYVIGKLGVSFSEHAQSLESAMTVTGVVWRDDGTMVAFEVLRNGRTEYAQVRIIADMIAAGKTVLMRSQSGQVSTLRVDGGFYSEKDGIENDDFLDLPLIDYGEVQDLLPAQDSN
jgi:hypothetical protein